MSFGIHVSAFENEGPFWIPVAAIRERFSTLLEETDGYGQGIWPLFFDEGPSAAELYITEDGPISGFGVDRPPDYLEFWKIIAGILRDLPCLLYWPNAKPVGIMGSLSLLPHIPKDFIHHMGIPLVSTDPERIRQYVRNNS